MGMQMLPEMKYHPQKGLNVNFSPEWVQQLMGSMQQQQRPGMPPMQMPTDQRMTPPSFQRRF